MELLKFSPETRQIYNMKSHGDFQSSASGTGPHKLLCGYTPILPFFNIQHYKMPFSPSPTAFNWLISTIDGLKEVWHSNKLQSNPLGSAKLINIILGKVFTKLSLVSVLP